MSSPDGYEGEEERIKAAKDSIEDLTSYQGRKVKAKASSEEEKCSIVQECIRQEGDGGDKHDDREEYDKASGEDSGEVESPGNEQGKDVWLRMTAIAVAVVDMVSLEE